MNYEQQDHLLFLVQLYYNNKYIDNVNEYIFIELLYLYNKCMSYGYDPEFLINFIPKF